MNMSTSDCSSGCESTWTMYLDQLSNPSDLYTQNIVDSYQGKASDDEEDGEDLSMVSDASSGPPHLDNEKCCTLSEDLNKPGKKKQNSKTKHQATAKKQRGLCLDDTASSPILHHHFSLQDDCVTPSEISPATHFQGESQSNHKHSNLFKSSSKGIPGKFHGKKRQ